MYYVLPSVFLNTCRSKVKDIDGLEEESIDAAVTFLHNSSEE